MKAVDVGILFFCGIKHSGKTTLGNLVAKKMGYSCVDNDQLIAEDRPDITSIRELYLTGGKEAFMEQEFSSLASFLAQKPENVIISLGGGACDNERLISLIRGKGKIVYLKVDQHILLKRILAGGIPPFLDAKDPELSFASLWARRDAIYGKISDFVVELPSCTDIRESSDYLFSRLTEELLDGSQ